MFAFGLSISHDIVLRRSADLANTNTISDHYDNERVVCPLKLRESVFTTVAIDNIDQNTSFTSSKSSSFHGSGIFYFNAHIL